MLALRGRPSGPQCNAVLKEGARRYSRGASDSRGAARQQSGESCRERRVPAHPSVNRIHGARRRRQGRVAARPARGASGAKVLSRQSHAGLQLGEHAVQPPQMTRISRCCLFLQQCHRHRRLLRPQLRRLASASGAAENDELSHTAGLRRNRPSAPSSWAPRDDFDLELAGGDSRRRARVTGCGLPARRRAAGNCHSRREGCLRTRPVPDARRAPLACPTVGRCGMDRVFAPDQAWEVNAPSSKGPGMSAPIRGGNANDRSDGRPLAGAPETARSVLRDPCTVPRSELTLRGNRDMGVVVTSAARRSRLPASSSTTT